MQNNKKHIYLAGDLLNRGAQLQRAEEKEAILKLGHTLYVPQDNKEINDKANLTNVENLADRIVRHDTQGIMESDVVVMEAREAALGTCIELGQLLGMRDVAEMIKANLYSPSGLEKIADKILNREIYIHNSDIRRAGNPTETGDQRSYGPHQYMVGAINKVTKGKGYSDFNTEILGALTDDVV